MNTRRTYEVIMNSGTRIRVEVIAGYHSSPTITLDQASGIPYWTVGEGNVFPATNVQAIVRSGQDVEVN